MTMPSFAKALRIAVAMACLGLTAMTREAPPQGLVPDHDDAPIWMLLKTSTRFKIDAAKGLYVASFDKPIQAAEGKPFTVSGYLLPLETTPSFRHFVVTRRNTGCPFCPPNEIGEAVEVFARKPVTYTQAEVTFTGRLKLVSSSAEGMFYRLDEAEIR
jgi:hypothetical protein